MRSWEGILPYKFEIYRGQDGLFYWRFKASNGDVMVSSDPYTTKSSAKHAIESMQANASVSSATATRYRSVSWPNVRG